jgi:autoinducer 2-degrading protein
MFVMTVTVWVRPGREQDFIEATRENHLASIREPDCVRFDVLQHVDDPRRFCLIEVYRDEAAAKAHKDTEHYQTWRDTVAGWMERPRKGIKHNSLFPADEGF